MKIWSRIAALLLASVLGARVFACCVAYKDNPILLVDEKVIIVWDEAKKLEHFIRQASFSGEGKDFGFIVPTPTKPEVAKADARAFQRLEGQIPKESVGGGCGCTKAEEAATGAAGVDVIEQYRVGDYLATILQATDGASLDAWLKKNGYKSRPAMVDWLDHYAKQRWFFAALKFIRDPQEESERTSALRITFKTEKPHYPYKMPDDTWPKNHYRPLALYFIGPDEAAGVYRGLGKDWEAKTEWSGDLPSFQVAGLAKELGLNPADIPEGSVLTALMNTNNAQGYGRDLDFEFGFRFRPWEIALIVAGCSLVAYFLIRLVWRGKRTPASV